MNIKSYNSDYNLSHLEIIKDMFCKNGMLNIIHLKLGNKVNFLIKMMEGR